LFAAKKIVCIQVTFGWLTERASVSFIPKVSLSGQLKEEDEGAVGRVGFPWKIAVNHGWLCVCGI